MKRLCFIALVLAFVANVFAAEPTGDRTVNKHWTVNPHLFANNMTMVGVIELNGAELRNDTYEIGAFSGTECRGSEILNYYGAIDRYLVYFTVYGEGGEEIDFRLYNHGNDYEFVEASIASVTFEVNAMHGIPSNPYVFAFDCPVYNITCQSIAVPAGTVSGGGAFFYGQSCTVSASAHTGYQFKRWTESGVAVSSSRNYTFPVSNSRDLIAVFACTVTDTLADACETFSWHGHTYTSSGVYHDTLTSYLGLDSVVDLHLTIHPARHIDLYETACEVYYWDDEPFHESGDYSRHYYSVYGCDSIETLHLTILPIRPLGNFTYMSPANNYIDRYTDMDFYWDAIPNADRYDFYFWQGEGGRPDTPTLSNTTSHSYQVGGLTHGSTYHWCVVAKNECQENESATRTFTCQLNPAMTVVPNGWYDFGEVEVGQTRTRTISVSGTALTENISYSYLDNAWGQDAGFFAITPSNWNPTTGGLLHVTFAPAATQLYYNTAIRIASGAFVDTLYFTGSMANRYVFTTNVDGEVFSANDNILITGHVEDVLGNPVPDMGVNVYLIVMGNKTTATVVSDANGNYSTTYTPRYSESGYYQVGSCAYGTYSNDVHDAFDIPGMSRVNSDFIIWQPYQDETLTGTVEIRNRSRIPISNIQVNPISLPNGCTVSFSGVSNLGALETGLLSYTVTGTQVSTGNSYEEATFQVTADNGITMNMTCFYYCRQRRGTLDVYPPSVATTMQRNVQKILSFQVTNKGNGETGPITVSLPDVEWMSLMGDDTLASLQVNDSCAFSIMLTPDANVGLNQYSGSIAVNCANGNGFSIPFQIMAVADTTATVVVDVTDDYTYNTNGGNGPHLEGANVSLRGYYTLETVATGLTDENGLFTVENVPEGWYYLNISADWHHEYSGIIKIETGNNNRQSHYEVYLQLKSHEYSWVVVPTEVEDVYEFELVAEIHTNVPIPVVTIECPPTFDTLAYGDTLQFGITLTNRGLIDAYEVQLTMPNEFIEYDFYPLFDFVDTLHAQTSVVIPCIMTRTQRNRTNRDEICHQGTIKEAHYWTCNRRKEWDSHVIKVKVNGYCSNTEDGSDITVPVLGSYGGMIGGIWGSHVNSGGGTGSGSPQPRPSNIGTDNINPFIHTENITTTSQDCTPCWKVAFEGIALIFQFFTGCSIYTTVMSYILYFEDRLDFYLDIIAHGKGNVLDFISNLYGDISAFRLIDESETLFEHFNHTGQLINNAWTSSNYPVDFLIDNNQYALDEFGPHKAGVLDYFFAIRSFIQHLRNCIRFTDPTRDNSDIDLIIDQMEASLDFCQAAMDELTNVFQEDEWWEEDDLSEFFENFMAAVDTTDNFVSPQAAIQLKEACNFTYVNDSIIQRFVDRWNRSIQYWNEDIYSIADLPEGYNGDFIQLNPSMIVPAVEAAEAAQAYGFQGVADMYHSSINAAYSKAEYHKTDVCAKISVSFKQTMTMTREAFEGTLKITNGHTTDPMQDIDVNIVIRDEDGVDRTDLFQINVTSLSDITGVDGTGTLAAQTEGIAQFMMIPTIEAAPDTTKIYSFGGSFSFLDPFSGTEVTYELFPVQLKVNPGPNLHVDYFISRNIISDDPLTEDTIEATQPAELAMMIRNVGAGSANNVYLESSQPQIIDNQNGLLISFDIVGAAMNGEPRPLGLTDIPFGTIASHTAGIAEWYFTSSLLARVVHSTPHVIHNDSYGNPNLSLVTELHSHDLIHAVRAYGDLEDGINDFFVNETPDFNHTPDKIYFSHGGTTSVRKILVAETEGVLSETNNEILLHVTPIAAGWNYACLDDPAEGQREILSCTRDDGQEIPLSNVWITWATMLDEGAPVHENKLHIVDTFGVNQPATYTLVYGEEAALAAMQPVELSKGWNWWSSYIEQGNINGLSMLENGLGHKGVTIKSQFDFVQNYYPNYGVDVWFGSLEDIVNEQGYMIDVTEDCSLVMSGVRAQPVSHPIAIHRNWNWIGYPVVTRQSVASALSGFDASPDDLIKSHYEFSVYYEGFGWFPDDLEMTPGEGYYYYSNADGSPILTYNNDSRGGALPERSDKRMWKSDVHAFADNISVVAVVAIDSVEQRDEGLELGAFVDGECRGSARLKHFGPLDRYYAMLSVSGQDGDKVGFGFVNEAKGQGSMASESRIAFERNGIVGSLETPYIVNFNTMPQEAQEGCMMLFPNPVERNTTFSLEIPGEETLREVVVVDMLGEEVLRKTGAVNPSAIEGLPVAGIYVVKAVTRSGNVYHGRLVVK